MDQLLDVSEAAQRLRISPCTLRRLMKGRRISYRRLGKRQFFTQTDLDRFLENSAIPVQEAQK